LDEERPLAGYLERFAAFHHMAAADLAAFLGTDEAALARLGHAALPDERARDYGEVLARLAAQSGASAARLAQAVRVARVLR
jgi:hypothetical protein